MQHAHQLSIGRSMGHSPQQRLSSIALAEFVLACKRHARGEGERGCYSSSPPSSQVSLLHLCHSPQPLDFLSALLQLCQTLGGKLGQGVGAHTHAHAHTQIQEVPQGGVTLRSHLRAQRKGAVTEAWLVDHVLRPLVGVLDLLHTHGVTHGVSE